MIPLHLILEGIYSYQERQSIDFQNLTEAGLFGIFGAVGSGKSSILEAITFVLYGKTERLNNADRRSYNMMNLKANKSYIAFDFLNFENKKFRATRDFKRNSKRFDDVKAPNVTIHELVDEDWEPTERKIEDIIGLSYDNFKRTIIIPQGQFKEFLELGTKDRTEMMKEIFNLQRFDLYYKASNLNTENKTRLDQLAGELKSFEEINEENIASQKVRLKEEAEKLAAAQLHFKKSEEAFQKLKLKKTDFLELKAQKENFLVKQKQKSSIEILEKKITEFEKVFKIFNPILVEKNRIAKEIAHLKEQEKDQNQKVSEIEKKIELNSEKISSLKEKFDHLEQSKIEENDYQTLIKIFSLNAEIEKLIERSVKGKSLIEKNREEQKVLKEEVNKCLKEIEDLKPKKLDATLLQNVWEWFSFNKNFKTSVSNQQLKIASIKNDLQSIIKELDPFKINIETYQVDFEQQFKNLEEERELLQKEKNQLMVQEKLANFSVALKEGEPCQLCGSLEHPHILEFKDVQNDLAKINQQLNEKDDFAKQLTTTLAAVERLVLRKDIADKNLEAENLILSNLNKELLVHQKSFVWTDFSADQEEEFLKKRAESFEIDKKIEAQNNVLAEKQKLSENCKENFEKYQKAIDAFITDQTNKEGQMQTHIENLQLLKWESYATQTLPELQQQLEKLTKENKALELSHQNLTQEKEELEKLFSLRKNTLSHISDRLSNLQKDLSEQDNILTETIREHNFSTIDEVSQIISQDLDVAIERERIQKFKVEYSTLENSIQLLTIKLDGFELDEEGFEKAAEEFAAAEILKNNLNDLVVKLQAELERIQKEFEKKSELIKKLAEVQKRAENLKTMINLFKAAGFVQYVSSIFLRQLCDQANIRFHRMTRNQLSLQLNENNDFEIIDYLNEGRCRSVKTLSGGQAFQVSLSLALALAESVQSSAKADRNFFFIDEGFGTQDRESVDIVFETLRGLQKENRIVGIISHVEELKEKIPVSLTIYKDEIRGSLIKNTI